LTYQKKKRFSRGFGVFWLVLAGLHCFGGGSPLFQLVPLSLYNILADLLQFELFFWPFQHYFCGVF
jgi:hypothetical protein